MQALCKFEQNQESCGSLTSRFKDPSVFDHLRKVVRRGDKALRIDPVDQFSFGRGGRAGIIDNKLRSVKRFDSLSLW